MPKIVIADGGTPSYEPIEVEVMGKTYSVISNLSLPFFNKVAESVRPEVQLAMVFGVDPEEFEDWDIRLVGSVVQATMDAIKDQIETALDPTAAGESN